MRELAELLASTERAGGGISQSDNVKFENEDAALDYAKRLAALKPGDEVLMKIQGKDVQRGVFLGPVEGGKMAHVIRFDDDMELCGAGVPWPNIRFPE